MEHKHLLIDGKKLHYTIEGKGNTVVLIHGFMESTNIWCNFSHVLANDFEQKVICIDLPGHGESDIFGEIHPIDMQAQCIEKVLEVENIDSIVIVGHSMGGYVCSSFANQFPKMTQGLLLFHSHTAADSERTKEFRNRTIELLNQNKTGFITQFIPDLFAEGNAPKFAEQIVALTEDAKKMKKEAIIASQIGMRDRPSYLDVLTEAEFPVGFIQGKRDTKSNLQKVLAQSMLPSHSEFLLIDCGHMGYIEKEKETLGFLASFAKRAFLNIAIAFTFLFSSFFLQAQTFDTLHINEWMTAGPIPLYKPAFDTLRNIKGESFTNQSWLGFPAFKIGRLEPSIGSFFAWDGKNYPWSLCNVETKNNTKGIFLDTQNNTTSKITFLCIYLENDVYRRITLCGESRQSYEIYLNGKLVLDKKTVENDSNVLLRNKKEITLEAGSHRLIVKSLQNEKSSQNWMFNAWISYENKNEKKPISLSTSSERKIDLADYLYGELLAQPALSFDGQYYAIRHIKTDPEKLKTENWIEIRQTQSDRLIQSFRGISNFSFAKNTNQFAYKKTQGKENAFYIFDLNTNTEKKVYESDEMIGNIEWDPQGNYLVFSISTESDKPKNGLKKWIGLSDRLNGWRTRSLLYKLDLASEVVTPLTHGYLTTSLVDISPDGKSLLFSTQEDCDSVRPYIVENIYLLSLENKQAEFLWKANGFFQGAKFAPDGKQILVIGSPYLFNSAGKPAHLNIANDYDSQAYLFDLTTKNAKGISLHFDPKIISAEWAPSSKQIWVMAEEKDKVNLFTLDLASLKYTWIPLEVEVLEAFSLAQNGNSLLYKGSSAKQSSRAYLLNTSNKKSRLLCYPMEKELKKIRIGANYPWEFKNQEGAKIEATYYLPPDFDSTLSYPMIVYYYGGTSPTARSFEMRYPKNVWASKGYIVLVLQPSGATGFGQDFSTKHVNNWGITVADEIIDGTRLFVKQHPYVDSSRIGCIGASYGGFMTQLIITRTPLFAAAISHAGISALSSYWGEGNWGYIYNAVAAANSFPWNRRDIYVDQSPLFNADKIQTPLLLLHGSADNNVPPGESIQMYTALRLLGKDVSFVEIEGENHGIMDPAKRLEWEKSILAWWEKYLKKDPLWWNELYPKKDL